MLTRSTLSNFYGFGAFQFLMIIPIKLDDFDYNWYTTQPKGLTYFRRLKVQGSRDAYGVGLVRVQTPLNTNVCCAIAKLMTCKENKT